jgi:DNA polymerase III delta subunit
MLYLFYGNDTVGVREKAHEFIATKEKAGVIVERIDSDTYTPGILTDVAGSSSLFGSESLYVIDTPSTQKDFSEEVFEHVALLGESANTFVIIEERLLAPEKKKLAKYAEEVVEVKKAAEERFNAFAMADSLAQKNKRMLWVQLQEAVRAGLSSEEIIGTLWWQLKSLRLAAITNSAAEAGMKDFPYNKAKRSLANFRAGELEKLSENLLALYHDGHGGRVDIDLALERWVLTL